MIEHHLAEAGPREMRVDKKKRNVGLAHLDVRCHEGTPNNHLPIESHAGEVWVTEGVRDVHSPEKLRKKSITGSHMASLQVTEVQ